MPLQLAPPGSPLGVGARRDVGGAALLLTRLMAAPRRAAEKGESAMPALALAEVVRYPTSSRPPGSAPVPSSGPGDAAPPPHGGAPPAASSARRVAAAAAARAVA
jgi:hypothetical protein